MADFIGHVVIFSGNFAPRDYALCNGQLMPISENQAMYAILGTIWGGDGRTSFALPDYRSRTPIGAGTGVGLTPFPLGQRRGQESVMLTPANMPMHSHNANFTPTGGIGIGGFTTVTGSLKVATDGTEVSSASNSTDAINASEIKAGITALKRFRSDSTTFEVLDCVSVDVPISSGGGGITGGTVNIIESGSDKPFPIWSPNLATHFIVMTQGVFPARN